MVLKFFVHLPHLLLLDPRILNPPPQGRLLDTRPEGLTLLYEAAIRIVVPDAVQALLEGGDYEIGVGGEGGGVASGGEGRCGGGVPGIGHDCLFLIVLIIMSTFLKNGNDIV